MSDEELFKPRPVWWIIWNDYWLRACARMAGVFSFVAVFAVLYVALQTLKTHHPPLEVDGDGTAFTSMAGDLIMVEYERNVVVHQDFTGKVTRTIVCQNGWTHDIPATIRNFTKGGYRAVRSFTFPYAVPQSTRCVMKTLVTWTPPFSLREHAFTVADIPFVLIDHEHPRKDITKRIDHEHKDAAK